MKRPYLSIVVLLLFAVFQCNLFAANSTYVIEDIGDWGGYYQNPNTADTYTGTGFVGMYQTSFGHLFGLEQTDYSRTAMQVDISELAGATINSAYLEFDLSNGAGGTQNITLTSYESTGTLGHYWNPIGPMSSQVYSVTGLNHNSLDVTGLVQETVDTGNDWLGLHLQASTLYQWTYTTTYGNADAAHVRMVVDYTNAVPAPGAFFLGGIGVTVVGWLKRRKAL